MKKINFNFFSLFLHKNSNIKFVYMYSFFKRTAIIVLFSFLPHLLISAQQIQGTTAKIDSFFTLVKQVTPNKKTNALTKVIPIRDADLEKAKRLLYDSYAYAEIEYHKKLYDWTMQWGSTAIKGVKDPIGIKPSVRIHKLKEAIAEKYGWKFVKFLETPYLLKVKILDKDFSSQLMDERRNFWLPEVDLRVEVLDIIKGEQFYSKGDTIMVGYLPFWFRDCKCNADFEVNSEYVLPLRHWSISGYKDPAELTLKLSGLYAIYKLENNIVVSAFFPEKSPNKSWEVFKKDIRKEILIED